MTLDELAIRGQNDNAAMSSFLKKNKMGPALFIECRLVKPIEHVADANRVISSFLIIIFFLFSFLKFKQEILGY